MNPFSIGHQELLWPHVREFADRTLAHIRRTLYGSGGAKPLELYLVHGEERGGERRRAEKQIPSNICI